MDKLNCCGEYCFLLMTYHISNVRIIRSVCVCCTGWAESKDVALSEPNKDKFLTALFKELKVERPLLISASMSGSYVLPYMMLPDSGTCSERVSAFVPLAPVSTARFSHAQYHRCEVCHLFTCLLHT